MLTLTIVLATATVAVAVLWPESKRIEDSRNQRILESEKHRLQAAWFERYMR